ncbi:MAG: hypothetical protein HY343_10515 [Lentisphaerae bacterium]|nr:hypothetical protein [Lentisphaerota bacterium]
MATLYFNCECAKSLAIDDAGVGRTFHCPDCGEVVEVPSPEVWWSCGSCGSAMSAPRSMIRQPVICVDCQAEEVVPAAPQPLQTKPRKAVGILLRPPVAPPAPKTSSPESATPPPQPAIPSVSKAMKQEPAPSPVPIPPKTPPAPAPLKTDPAVRCPICGTAGGSNQKYCGKCRASMGEPEADATEEPLAIPSGRSSWLGAIMVLFILGVGGWFGFRFYEQWKDARALESRRLADAGKPDVRPVENPEDVLKKKAFAEYRQALRDADFNKANMARRSLDGLLGSGTNDVSKWEAFMPVDSVRWLVLASLCPDCEGGTCPLCKGSGVRTNEPEKCAACSGTGTIGQKCPACLCAGCRGTGGCSKCNGVANAQIPCAECQGRGKWSQDSETICPRCHGSRKIYSVDCKTCEGTGHTTPRWGGKEVKCEECKGRGHFYNVDCTNCSGTGRIKTPRTMSCSRCQGRGWNSCTACGASGKCPDCGGLGRKASCAPCQSTGKTAKVCEICKGVKGKATTEPCAACQGERQCRNCSGQGVLIAYQLPIQGDWLPYEEGALIQSSIDVLKDNAAIVPQEEGRYRFVNHSGLIPVKSMDRRYEIDAGNNQVLCVSVDTDWSWLSGAIE